MPAPHDVHSDSGLDARKSAILRKVVSEHIATGQPIGSAHVVRDGALEVSPATVRSDMAVLERDGYLTHPHTSAGRIPTDKGYRFFVDEIKDTAALDANASGQVKSFFSHTHGELERLLRDTSRLLSRLTDYASVVTTPKNESEVIRSALVTRLSPSVALLVVVLSNGAVEKYPLAVPEILDDAEFDEVNTIVRDHFQTKQLDSLTEAPRSRTVEIDKVVGACRRALLDTNREVLERDDVFVGGVARMADQFVAVDTVKEVLSILEQSFVVVTLLQEMLSSGQTVLIGIENGVSSLSECSIVVAPYEIDQRVVGTIGVLGPTRMNYPQALAAVAVVSERLGHELSKG